MNCGPGAVVWLTGLPGSGKTTLALELLGRLSAVGRPAAALDGDELRRGLCSDLGFGRRDRAENARRAAEAAALMARAGLVCVVALISPYAADRAAARAVAAREGVRFLEVFVDAPLGVCEMRDPKGLYRGARSGAVAGLTGVSAPYEPPEGADVRVRTDAAGPAACAALVLASLWPAPDPGPAGAPPA